MVCVSSPIYRLIGKFLQPVPGCLDPESPWLMVQNYNFVDLHVPLVVVSICKVKKIISCMFDYFTNIPPIVDS